LRRFALLVVVVLVLAVGPGAAGAASLHSIGDFKQPVYVTSDPVNPDRLLIAEREGRVVETGPGGTRQLADFSSLVTCCESERGLLSILPAPDFDSTGHFYAAYTGTTAAGGAEGDVHLDFFQPGANGQLLRDPILSVDHAENENHDGGQLQFGPDGHLYMSLGDGGGGGDPHGNAQNIEVLLGKIIRIDPRPGQSPSYTNPAGNPFVGAPGRDEIWAYGLRNPWRFSFDRTTSDMVIGDVGQDAREEVDFAPSGGAGAVGGAGANYGWNCREGFIPYAGAPGGCPSTGFTDPVFDYPHKDPGGGEAFGCSIIGGYVVRDQSLAGLYGRYLYTDYCGDGIRSLVLPATASGRAGGDRSEGLSIAAPTSFGQDSCGRIYVASSPGPVYRLEGPSPAVCPQPEPVAVTLRKRPVRVRLRARRRGSRTVLTARVAPCANFAGQKLRLNRGGKRFRSRRLSQRCSTHFLVRVRGRVTFRAVLLGETPVRSRRLSLGSRQGR
jgi:glucose/sorbosone dehydrogenase